MKYVKVLVPDEYTPETHKIILSHESAAGEPVMDQARPWQPEYRNVLDHGFIGLVDFMGDDQAIVDSARVSYGRGTKRATEDPGLIRYLMRHHHGTPFEMPEFRW